MDLLDLKPVIDKIHGATFASIDTMTTPRLLGGQGNPQQGKIRKIMTGAQVLLTTDENSSAYENMVRRRLEKEGKDPLSFSVQPPKWGKRIPGTPLVEHKGKFYLACLFLTPGKVGYVMDTADSSGVEVFAPIHESAIQGLQDRRPLNQGLSRGNEVTMRTFSLESLTAVRAMKGEIS